MTYTPASWLPIVQRLIAAEYPRIDVGFAMRWLEIESGGNPCAIGTPGQLGPDGNPAEIGLGQLYNPDDFAAFRIATAPLRAYCVPGTQTVARALTPAEQDDQVRYTLLAKIAQGMQLADAMVLKHDLVWGQRDYYKLVKAPHALPSIIGGGLHGGLSAVVRKLGRAPVDWAEFRDELGMDGHEQWKRALDACETCGDAAAAT